MGLSKRRQGSGILKEEKRANFFFSSSFFTFLSLSHIKHFSLSPEVMIHKKTTQLNVLLRII